MAQTLCREPDESRSRQKVCAILAGVAIVSGTIVVSWSAGSSGPPSGSCTTGSLYSNTSGSPNTLYACTAANTWKPVI